jgi:hypothetical protein
MLPDLDEFLSLLQQWPEIRQTQVLDYEVDAGIVLLLKIRGDLPNGYAVQIRLRLEGNMTRYSYQLLFGAPVIRWDSAPHYPATTTSPHHFHDESERVHASPLTGDIAADILTVMGRILEHIGTH